MTTLSTHVLDTATGRPAPGITVAVEKESKVIARGVTDADGALLDQAFGIKTVRDLGSNKYFSVAGVLVALAGHEG